MSLNIFVAEDILPQKISFYEPRRESDTSFLLNIYYAVLFNSELSKDGRLCINKPEILYVLKISETTLDNALFTLRKNGYLDLIQMYLKVCKENYKLPNDLKNDFKEIQNKVSRQKVEYRRQIFQKMIFKLAKEQCHVQ